MAVHKQTAREARRENGYWTSHPDHPIEDWRSEIANDNTRQGYWEWAFQREEED